jgi:GNAT superfamily N-acetyltransferase
MPHQAPWRIRAALAADFAVVQSLVFGMHARALAATGHNVASRLAQIFPSLESAAAFGAPGCQCWVAVGDAADSGGDALLGAITIIKGSGGGDAAELNAFYVDSAHQRRGIGARLMDEALAFCRGAGARRVTLTSNRGHYDAAIAFYKRRGFAEVREFEVAPGISLVEMELKL